MNNEENKPDRDQAITLRIQALANETKSHSDPDELEHLKKLIKRNVPFTLRGYFMAYLLRQAMKGQGKFERKGNKPQRGPKVQKEAASEHEAKPAHEQKPLPEGAKTLYLNIGKMRRLYAKDLSQIVQETLGVASDDIYAIRIHDKYSFVSMSQEHCEQAIEKMNGMEIKGRTISVTYSNKD